MDFRGQASVAGTMYRFPAVDEGAFALVGFSGSWVAPAFQGDPTVSTVNNPFTFTGFIKPEQVFLPEWRGSVERVRATYTFTPEPIPEPTSMPLFGTGLAALGRIVRQRRRVPRPGVGRV